MTCMGPYWKCCHTATPLASSYTYGLRRKLIDFFPSQFCFRPLAQQILMYRFSGKFHKIDHFASTLHLKQWQHYPPLCLSCSTWNNKWMLHDVVGISILIYPAEAIFTLMEPFICFSALERQEEQTYTDQSQRQERRHSASRGRQQ